MEIELTKGQVAIVDEKNADLALLNWYCHNGYAARATPGDRGKLEYLHRVVYERELGRKLEPGEEVDHIDRNTVDNRIENLRLATRAQNMANKGKQKGTYSSEYKGVYWNKAKKKWQAQIKVNYKRIHLGYFDLECEAAMEYDWYAKKYFGEFARLNFPIEEKVLA